LRGGLPFRNDFGEAGTSAPDIKELAKSVAIAPEFLEDARTVIAPGTTLIITDVRVNDQTHSRPGFNILTAD